MFGICVWAELIKKNIFYNINKQLAKVCGSQIHNPHITLKYNIKSKINIENLKKNKKDYFKKGNVYQSNNKNFYSLQQDYVNNIDKKIYHVSLAYKVDKPFTKNEIEYANTLKIPLQIKSNEYNITIWNCDSVYTKDWYKINI